MTEKIILHDEFFQDDKGNEFCVCGYAEIESEEREVTVHKCRVWGMKNTYDNKPVVMSSDSFATSVTELIRNVLRLDHRYKLSFDCEIVRI